MAVETQVLLAILLMTVVTYATRAGGIFLMAYVPLTPRMEAFLKALAVSVLISIVVPATLKAGPRGIAAVAVAVAVMLATRSAIGAMLAGTATAALWRLL